MLQVYHIGYVVRDKYTFHFVSMEIERQWSCELCFASTQPPIKKSAHKNCHIHSDERINKRSNFSRFIESLLE